MTKITYYLIFILFTHASFAANRPYNEIISEFKSQSCTQEKENIFLSSEERSNITKVSGTKLYGGLALRYITSCPDNKKYYHYVDSHIVRTLNETVVITINQDQLTSFIVSSFNEPPEYMATKKWYEQFEGTKIDKRLRARQEIDALSGATLTVNASIGAVNKILALHKTLATRSK